MARKSLVKGKKHEILGGIKVSSQQLSKWGKLGGRPQKYLNSAERARAFRLKKKQERFGLGVELRNYRSYEEKPNKVSSFVRLICDKCGAKSIGSLKHLNQQCFCCHQGKLLEERINNIIKRAGSSKERVKRFREKGKIENMNKKQECQHD
jgi:hypothetical protein